MKNIYLLALACLCLSIKLNAQTCTITDVPDPYFQDANADGIDGDAQHAIFVAPSGNDSAAGNQTAPVQTIERAIQLASNAGKDVYAAAGTYTLSNTLQVASGVSLYGLFSGPPAWARGNNNNATIISGPATTVLVNNITAETHIEGFEIRAANAANTGESSYGIVVKGNAAKTVLRYNTIKPGQGTAGTNGTDGANGAAGGNGSNGQNGTCDGSNGGGGTGAPTACGLPGGNGGAGGAEGNNKGVNGGAGGAGANGGIGGNGGDPGSTGGNGTNGATGVDGANGAAAITIGSVDMNLYQPANGTDGTAATDGISGGGGGGGGGQGCTLCNNGGGNGGGGGGSGGCAGTLATAGTGGGGSFGVILVNGLAVVNKNNIITAAGGNGGRGGNGGQGGTKGTGGQGGAACTGEIGAGGKGGDGGNGGSAGSGSGGSGGPSIGIYVDGTSVVLSDTNTYTIAAGGNAGSGGSNGVFADAASGAQGTSANVFGTITALPADTPGICVLDTAVLEPASGNIATVRFTVLLSAATEHTVTMQYATADVTAVDGTDYIASSGTFTFLPGQVSQTALVTIVHNAAASGDKTFNLNVSNIVGAQVFHNPGVCTIHAQTVGINDLTQTGDYALSQNIPNPTSGLTDIYFMVPQASNVDIKLYNLNGQLVTTLYSGQAGAGQQRISFDAASLADGVYFYSLVSGNFSAVKKMSVMK